MKGRITKLKMITITADISRQEARKMMRKSYWVRSDKISDMPTCHRLKGDYFVGHRSVPILFSKGGRMKIKYEVYRRDYFNKQAVELGFLIDFWHSIDFARGRRLARQQFGHLTRDPSALFVLGRKES